MSATELNHPTMEISSRQRSVRTTVATIERDKGNGAFSPSSPASISSTHPFQSTVNKSDSEATTAPTTKTTEFAANFSSPTTTTTTTKATELSDVENVRHFFSRTTTSVASATIGENAPPSRRVILRRRSSRRNKNPLLSETYSQREYKFVIGMGMLLSFNAGYINASCVSGLLSKLGTIRQAVSGYTGTYTKSALNLAAGKYELFQFGVCVIASFICGAFITGIINPHVPAHRIAPTFCPTFLIGAAFLIGASILVATQDDGNHDQPKDHFYIFLVAAANGIQNGISSLYSASLIRTTHHTGAATDISIYIGQMVRGNFKNQWKFQVLVALSVSFWTGGVVSFYGTTRFASRSLLFNAGLFLAIGIALMVFLIYNLDITFLQVLFGNWNWKRALSKLNLIDKDGNVVSEERLMQVFDEIDTDESGTIELEELYSALKCARMRGFNRKSVQQMMSLADENNDGSISKSEWKAFVHGGIVGEDEDEDEDDEGNHGTHNE